MARRWRAANAQFCLDNWMHNKHQKLDYKIDSATSGQGVPRRRYTRGGREGGTKKTLTAQSSLREPGATVAAPEAAGDGRTAAAPCPPSCCCTPPNNDPVAGGAIFGWLATLFRPLSRQASACCQRCSCLPPALASSPAAADSPPPPLPPPVPPPPPNSAARCNSTKPSLLPPPPPPSSSCCCDSPRVRRRSRSPAERAIPGPAAPPPLPLRSISSTVWGPAVAAAQAPTPPRSLPDLLLQGNKCCWSPSSSPAGRAGVGRAARSVGDCQL